MQVFSGKIRPRGDLDTEVVRKDLTAAEVMVLRALHGDDGVVDLRLIRNDRREHETEYQRLVAKYGRWPAGREAVANLFGSPQNPNMPASLKGFKDNSAEKVTARATGKGDE